MGRENKCNSCGQTMLDHVYSRLPDKKWSAEELKQWEDFRKKENLEAESYSLKTRSELISIIEGLYKTQEGFKEGGVSGTNMHFSKKQLRLDVKEAVNKLLALI